MTRGEYIMDYYIPAFSTGSASTLDKAAKITKSQEAKKVPFGFAAPPRPKRQPRKRP